MAYEFPRYISKNKPTTQQPSVFAPESTEGQVTEQAAKVTQTAQEGAFKLANAYQEAQKTTAELNQRTAIDDLVTRASTETDVNGLERYQQENEKIRKDSLSGIKNKFTKGEAEAKASFYSSAANNQLKNIFTKKMIDNQQANMLGLLDLEIKNPTDTTESRVKAIIDQNKKFGFIDHKDAYELEKKTIKDMKQNSFIRDLNSGTEYASEKLGKNEYGFDVTELDKAKRILGRAEKREQEALKEFKFNSAIDAGVSLVNGTLTQDSLRDMVLSGQIDSKLAGAMELALFSPKKTWENYADKHARQVSGEYYIKTIERMDKFNPDTATEVLRNAVTDYVATPQKIKEKDLSWIIKTIDEKRKAPDDPIWSKLSSALKMMPDALSGGAFSKFSQMWDFKDDPRPIMKQAIIDQQKENDPSLANYELGTVIKRKSGSYEVVGFNEDGKPVFRKK